MYRYTWPWVNTSPSKMRGIQDFADAAQRATRFRVMPPPPPILGSAPPSLYFLVGEFRLQLITFRNWRLSRKLKNQHDIVNDVLTTCSVQKAQNQITKCVGYKNRRYSFPTHFVIWQPFFCRWNRKQFYGRKPTWEQWLAQTPCGDIRWDNTWEAGEIPTGHRNRTVPGNTLRQATRWEPQIRKSSSSVKIRWRWVLKKLWICKLAKFTCVALILVVFRIELIHRFG